MIKLADLAKALNQIAVNEPAAVLDLPIIIKAAPVNVRKSSHAVDNLVKVPSRLPD